jgi:hypothetical protein
LSRQLLRLHLNAQTQIAVMQQHFTTQNAHTPMMQIRVVVTVDRSSD